LANDVLFSLHHLCQITADLFELKAVSGGLMPGEMEVIRGRKQRFAWDTADVKASAAQNLAFVDNRCV
jgi:hypothetical protein